MSDVLRFPFGAPVKPCGTQTPPVAEAFILGAYPSALHVGWTMPSGQKVFAIAVDNEPEVFWDGRGEDCYFEQWKVKVGFDSSWGMFTPRANGPSGKWLHPNIYDPLSEAGISSKFITDCLPTYRMSAGGQRAIEGRYLDFASATRGLVPAHLDSHPSEGQIVAECISLESERILDQFVTAQPRLVITLGNAAARVMHHLAGLAGTAKLQRQTYGRPRDVVLRGSAARWFPLIHPAARDPWPSYHETWLDGGGFKPFL